MSNPTNDLSTIHNSDSGYEEVPSPSSSTVVSKIEVPLSYSKHTNLDLKPLTLREQLRLFRLYYFTVPKCIYFATALFCITWFVFNTIWVLDRYLESNSVVVLEYKTPVITQPPAITFCTQCLLCSFWEDNSDRTFYYHDIFENDRILNMLNAEPEVSREKNYANNSIVPMDDVQILCVYMNDSITNRKPNDRSFNSACSHYTKAIISMQEGSKCYTFFSQIYGKSLHEKNLTSLLLRYDYQPLIMFRIAGQMLYAPNSSIKVAMHSPIGLPPMINIPYHKVVPGIILDLHFGKSELYLRSPPAEPKCFNYRVEQQSDIHPDDLDDNILTTSDRLITPKSESIYRSMAECYIYCMWRRLLRGNTVNMFADFSNELITRVRYRKELDLMRLSIEKKLKNDYNSSDDINDDSEFWIKFGKANHESKTEYVEAKQQCMHICPQHCSTEAFPDAIVQNFGVNDRLHGYVYVRWATQPVTLMTYQGNMDLSEFLGSIGGHAHIWMSISIIQIVRYLVRMVRSRQLIPLSSSCLFGWFYRWWNLQHHQ